MMSSPIRLLFDSLPSMSRSADLEAIQIQEMSKMSSDLITNLVSSGLVHVTDRIINQYLSSVRDVCHFEQVSCAWNSLILDEFHWKYKYDHQYSLDVEPEQENKRFRNVIDNSCSKLVENCCSFKDKISVLFSLNLSWKENEPKETRIECDSFVLCLDILGDNILVGLNNGCMQEWGYFPEYDDISFDFKNLRTPNNPSVELLRQREVHSRGVKSVCAWKPHQESNLDSTKSKNEHLRKNKVLIATGSYDGTVKVWSYNDLELIITFLHHTDGVWDVKIFKNFLASCGTDGKLAVLKYTPKSTSSLAQDSFTDHFVIQAHSEQASTVDFNDKYLITGSECCTVGVWSMDVEPGKNLHLLEGHNQGITEVRILNGQDTRPMCVSGSYDGSIRMWSIKTGLCLAVLLGHRDFVRSLTLIDCPQSFQRIISGDYGGFIKIWEIADILEQVNPHMIKSLKKGSYKPLEFLEYRSQYPHRNHVTCLKSNQTKIISGSRDKTVVINDFMYSYKKQLAIHQSLISHVKRK